MLAQDRLYADEIRIPITLQIALPPDALEPPPVPPAMRVPRPALPHDRAALTRSPQQLATEYLRHSKAIDGAMQQEAARARRNRH